MIVKRYVAGTMAMRGATEGRFGVTKGYGVSRCTAGVDHKDDPICRNPKETDMLIMTKAESQHMIKRVDFFAEQVKQRVWDSFKDFDQQVNAHVYGKPEYMLSGDFADLAEIADIVFEDRMEFSELLFDLSRNITLASVAALYHQWEKDIRQFMERELQHYIQDPDVVWKQSTETILRWLETQCWPVQQQDWFPIMDACRLVVNVYKHGKGKSLDELKEKYPQYLDLVDDALTDEGKQALPYVDHDHLHVTEGRFDEFVESVRQFWSTFPGQIYLKSSS